MPKFPTGGKIRVSLTPPPLGFQRDPIETEVKYYGLIRDEALFDIEEPSKALNEVLQDIQDPAEAATEGKFTQQDVEILDGIVRYNLKNEDFNVLLNSSLNVEDSKGSFTSLVNPRQRVIDRITQLESFAGRGTLYQGQGTVLFKYSVPLDEKDSTGPSAKLYSHTNPPPFYTTDMGDVVDSDHPDYIPVTQAEIDTTHRIGFLQNGVFVPSKETEWWWSGEYDHEARDRVEYGDLSRNSLNDPQYPIVKDGNLSFNNVKINGISADENWGFRCDTWFKKETVKAFSRFAVQVHGHVRIDYFEKTGYDSNGKIQGSWKKALDTRDPNSYFIQNSKEQILSNSTYRFARYFIQGGPTTNYGAGGSVLPNYATLRGTSGGVWDNSLTYNDREGNPISRFNNEYVPVVIRFWYGQKDPSEITNASTPEQILASAPSGKPLLILDHIQSDGYVNWNDHSSRVKLEYVSADGNWKIIAGGAETNFNNYNSFFEVFVYKKTEDNPDGAGSFNQVNWDIPSNYIGGSKISSERITFTIPGYTPTTNGEKLWVVLRNRPWSAIPYGTIREEVWQRNLFNPSILGKYETSKDLLEGDGPNYREPDPKKVTFDENFDYYKSKYGQLPELDTYGPARYDGMIRTEITDTAGTRDYDYDHAKLLFIGRQKKGTVSELGTGNPNKVGRDKVNPQKDPRDKGENYTFINVISDSGGNGGNVVINAYPANSMGVLRAGNTGTFDKALHLADNTSTYSNPSRQNIQKLAVNELPIDGTFDVSATLKIQNGADSLKYIYRTSLDGNTYDTAGAFSTSTMGGALKDNRPDPDIKTAFLIGFKLKAVSPQTAGNGTEYSFYGPIGAIREAVKRVQITTNASVSNQVSSASLFPNIIGANSYQGTLIDFRSTESGPIVASGKVSAFDVATNKVTVTLDPGMSLTVNTPYFIDIWYNFLKLTKVPANLVSVTGTRTPTGSIFADNTQFQGYFVYNGTYQYSRVDNGAGLSFAETLFFDGDDASNTESRPFLQGTEAPAPPADIVTPFGYDNGITSSDPGLGGLCYPPYTTQSIPLFSTVKTTDQLELQAAGNFDVWWGSRNNPTTLGGNYLEVTNKLMFDFKASDRANLLSVLSSSNKPDFIGAIPTPYSHKLEVEFNVSVPTGPNDNPYLYKDVQRYSNNNPVKDSYFLFINKNGSDLEVLTENNPNWT